MGTLRVEKENAIRTEAERKRHEIEQKRREVELSMAARDHHLDAAQRDLRNRSEELDTLTLAEKTSTSEYTQRRDDVVRQRDDKLLREESARALRPIARPPSDGAKKRKEEQ